MRPDTVLSVRVQELYEHPHTPHFLGALLEEANDLLEFRRLIRFAQEAGYFAEGYPGDDEEIGALFHAFSNSR